MKSLLKESNIFIFTSLQEGLPRSLMEAMAVGLPIVATKIRGNVDLIDDKLGGFLCDLSDEECYSIAVRNLIQDEQLSKNMIIYNHNKIKQFDIKIVELQIEKIYKELFN
jgi:glycosyltransferase involved in cell wall biosynthesis